MNVKDNLNKLCTKFEVDISKNELSVRFCLGIVKFNALQGSRFLYLSHKKLYRV